MEREEARRLLDEKADLTEEQIKEIYQGLIIDLKSYRSKDVPEMLIKLKDNLKEQHKMQDAGDVASLDMMIVKAFREDMHAWRGRPYAKEALKLLQNFAASDFQGKEAEYICSSLASLGQDFQSFMDFKDAGKAYAAADDLALDVGLPLQVAAGFRQKEIICLKLNGTEDEFLPSEEELTKTYKEASQLPVSALQGRGYLLHDPVEASDQFQEVYDEVMEEAYKEIDLLPDSTPQERWAVIKKYFLKHGIRWRDPGEMNPGMMFR